MRWFDVVWSYLDWWLWDCCVSQRPRVSRMRKFCRHFLWEPRPAFTSVTSDLSSHGQRWVHTCTDTQYLGPYTTVACFCRDCGKFSCECVCLLLITRMLQRATSCSLNSKCQKWFDSHGPVHMVTSLSVHACPLVMTQLMNAVFFIDWLFWEKACFAQWSAKLTWYVLNRLKHAKPERHDL